MALTHNILHRDGTNKVYQNPAISGQYLYFTNKGDDIANGVIGNGNALFIDNSEGALEKHVDIQFLEDIQIKDATIFWENANWGDSVFGEVILSAGTPYLKVDKKGNAAKNENGEIINITASPVPDETWTGDYILFPIDVPLIRFLNNFQIFGSNNIGTLFESEGVALIPKELKLRLQYKSTVPNPNIKLSLMIEIFREKTV